jgi:hypothetical protein
MAAYLPQNRPYYQSPLFIVQYAYIQGPSLPGTNAPIIFDLGGPVFRPGNDFGTPPTYRFFSPFEGTFGAGPFTLTDSQISDLENGLWYVNATTATMTNGQLRGQIVPKTLWLTATLTGSNETPPNNSPWHGIGSFSLTGTTLNYELDIPLPVYPTGGGIFDANGVLASALGTPVIAAPGPSGQPGEAIYFGTVALNLQSIADILAGKWFANVMSDTFTNGEIHGQILLQTQATLNSAVVTDSSLTFAVSNVNNLDFIIQANTSLGSTNWVSLATNTAPFTFIDMEITNYPQRFYRALYRP